MTWLSPAARSAASEPSLATLLDSWSIVGLSLLRSLVSSQGPFPPPALPGLDGTTGPSAICPGRPRSSRTRRCRAPPRHSGRLPLLRVGSSPVRAATTTPAGSPAARLVRFAGDGGLPRHCGGRLPRRLFGACSMFARAAARTVRCPSERGVSWSASDHSSPPDPPQVLPAGTRAAGWDRPTDPTHLQGAHNAPTESFFGSLETELVHRTPFPTREAAKRAIFEYVEAFYNRRRRHSGLGFLTPAQAYAQMARAA